MLPLEKEEVLVVYKGPQTKEKTKKKKKKKVKCGGTLQQATRERAGTKNDKSKKTKERECLWNEGLVS